MVLTIVAILEHSSTIHYENEYFHTINLIQYSIHNTTYILLHTSILVFKRNILSEDTV